MSKLKQLLNTLCPEGIEYRPLEEVAEYSKVHIDVTQVNAENYVGVDNLISNKQGKTISSYVPSEGRLIQFKSGDILIGNIRPYLKKIWLATHDGGTNGDVLAIQIKDRNVILPKYLYYILSSDAFFYYDTQNSKGAKMPRGDKSAVMRYRIQVPPIPVQEEVIRILDIFTERTAELATSLTTELAIRQQQYAHYRTALLSKCISKKPLSKIMISSRSGGTPLKSKNEYYEGGTIPWLRTQEVVFNEIHETDCYITDLAVQETSAKWVPANCVIVAISGASAGRCAINKIPLTTNQHCLAIEIDPAVAMYKYVFYCVSNQYRELLAKKEGARGDLNAARILSLEIPVPSLHEQERIVKILDRFDTLCSDITEGLSTEIKVRQQQYEHYRDKLLNFKEKEVDVNEKF